MPFAGYFLGKTVSIDSFSGRGIMLQSVGILLLLICIPLGLKTFSIKIRKIKLIEDENEKLTKYLYWARIRIASVAIPLLFNILIYYLTQNNSMIFSAGISALALLFCKPQKHKMEEELGLNVE